MDYDAAIAALSDAIDPGIFTAAKIDHISYSNLSLLANCSEKWRQRYVLKKKSGKSFPMAVGSGIHRAVECYHLKDDLESACAAGRAKFRKEMDFPSQQELAQADAAVERMLNAYADKYEVEAAATEKEIDVELAHGVTLKVVVDLVQDGVVDIKSIARAREKFTPDEMQLFFGLLAMHSEGTTLKEAEIRPLRRDVTGARAAIALEPFPFSATEEWIQANTEAAVALIKDAQARLKSDLWDGPEYEKKWMCNHCDYARECGVLNAPIKFTGSLL